MAVQFTDFSRAPLLDSPYKDLLGNVLKGYKMAKEPEKMADESKQRKLANSLKGLELEHKPKEFELGDRQKELANALSEKANAHYEEKFQLEKDYKQAQIQKALQQKIGGSPKANGEFANFLVANPDATPEEKLAAYNEIHGKKMEHEQATIDRSKDIVGGNSFDKEPINDKKQSVALMKGMGADPVEAVDYLRQKGHSPSTYAKEKGIDIHTVVPDYAAGEQNIKDAQRIVAYKDEIDSLEKHINDGLGKYQNKIKGYSMQQIADAAEGKNTDTQAKALAARALLPELNSLRLKIMGGNIGIEALNELKHTSLGELNVIESLIDEKTFNAAQNYMNQWIDEASGIRYRSLMGNSMLKQHLDNGANNTKSSKAEKQSNEEPVIVSSANGFTIIKQGNKRRRIPTNLVDRYMIEHSNPAFGGQYGD